MPIRRHITTTIDEIDDSADSYSPTNLPTLPAGRPPSDAQIKTPTEFPSDSSESEIQPSSGSRLSPATVGRTWADLMVEFKNDPRAVAVTLTVISVIIVFMTTREIGIESLKYALVIAAIFNAIWFGITVLVSHKRKIKRPIAKM